TPGRRDVSPAAAERGPADERTAWAAGPAGAGFRAGVLGGRARVPAAVLAVAVVAPRASVVAGRGVTRFGVPDEATGGGEPGPFASAMARPGRDRGAAGAGLVDGFALRSFRPGGVGMEAAGLLEGSGGPGCDVTGFDR